jgi:hypothetical protein
MKALRPILVHAVDQIRGGDHPRPPSENTAHPGEASHQHTADDDADHPADIA